MPSAQTPQHRASTKFWLVAVGVFILFVAIAAYVQWQLSSGPDLGEPEPYVAPIVSPEIQTIEDVREYTAGRPIPEVSEDATAGNLGTTNRNVIGEHVRGDPNARLSIVEYASLHSTYARLIYPEIQTLVNNNPDVNWIFRHYPLTSISLDYPTAYMSECVYNQSGDESFWSFVDGVYATPGMNEEELLLTAKSWVSDHEALQSCYDNLATEKAVKDDKRLGYFNSKVRVVPTFVFVDNVTGQERIVEGIDTPDFFQSVINTMLQAGA